MAADTFVKEACIGPLEKAAGMQVPSMAISSKSGVNQCTIHPTQKHVHCSSERIRVHDLEFGGAYADSC